MSDSQQKIRLLVVDDIVETRNNLINLLYFEKDIEVIGSATSGIEGIETAKKLQPDIVLMDINMPDMDGITATERIKQTLPNIAVIMMSVQGEQDYLRRAMRAGASEFLVKPFSGDELIGSIRHVYSSEVSRRRFPTAPIYPVAGTPSADGGSQEELGKVISIFSPKGGVGRTVIISNLAVAVKQISKKRVALVDGSLFFGDVSMMLDVRPVKTISDLQGRADQLDSQLLNDVMMSHSSQVRVLLAPPKPDQAELITADEITRILQELRRNFDYIFVDTFPSLKDETQLAILDTSDTILTIMTLEMPAIKDIRLFLEVAEILEYSRDKIVLVLNRVDSKHGLKIESIESTIQHPVAATIPSSGITVTLSINQGTPLVLDDPNNPFSKGIEAIAHRVIDQTLNVRADKAAAKNGAIAPKRGLFGLFSGKK
ncbi:response regulator [Candidatus Chlorohelix sp.]|uniref:response regulator n=1 Tax=Candidatus Chlorohelix sp. TaxID=3139201 RepID=UPI003050AAEF